MNLREMECILELAKEKCISKAAQNLYISQPALSQCLNRVESQLNAKLFTRGKEGMFLTFAGERYVEMSKRVIKMYSNFETDLTEIDRMHTGRIRVGTTVHLGSLILPQVLPIFSQQYPNIEISVVEATSRQLERYISESEIDISMMHLPFLEIQADYEEILKDRFVMVFSEDHLLNRYKYEKGDRFPYIDPHHAKGQTFVLAFPYQRVRQICNRILEKADIEPNVMIQSTSVQTALRLASVGIGITFMPESYIPLFHSPREPVYCYMEDEYKAFWKFVVAFENGKELSRAAREFMGIIKTTVQNP